MNTEWTSILSENEKFQIAEKISSMHKKLNDKRGEQLSDIKTVSDAIYSTNSTLDGWSSNVKLPEIYELSQTMKAHFWENIYSNPDGMFDVTGIDEESAKNAKAQKALLINTLENMKVSSKLDKAMQTLIETGESIIFIGWEQKSKFKRVKSYNECGEIKINRVETEVYSGPYIKNVPPENFVFDTKNDFDSALKIYQEYKYPNEIFSNPMFSIDEETKLKLKDIVEPENSDHEGKIKVLEAWGDFKTEKGYYKNYLAVIAGDDIVLRFEENPYVINPFVYFTLIKNPENQRGVSPLKIAMTINNISSSILNKQLDALNLILNPPYLAPKGCFTGVQDVSPGKIIEYEAALMPTQPTPLKFEGAMKGWEFLSFFKDTIESATGVFKNSLLNGLQPRSATEVSYSASAQSTRLAMAIDLINQQLIIPIVEKTAEYLANFSFNEEIIPVKIQDKIEFLSINENVKNGNYKYRYGDRKATLERKMKFQELFSTVSTLIQTGKLEENIDMLECFKYCLEQYGIENPSRFILEKNEKKQGVSEKKATEGNTNVENKEV